MAWLRLHEGVSLDVKWPLIARKANTNVGTVVAVWTAMLDYASQQQVRGTITGFDCESIDAFYGFEDGVCQSVFDALTAKGMIKDGIITNWEKRQPKKEDESAALRKQQQRERDKAAKTQDVTNTDAQSQPVTQCHDASRDVTLDKIRIEEIKEIKESSLRSDSFCAEQSCDSSPRDDAEGQPLPLISLPLNNGKLHAVMPDDAEHWQELYPAVDVRQELRNMLGWLEANPKKRKTATGIKAFITRWLADKQDKGGSPRASPRAILTGEKQNEGDRAAKKTWENYQSLKAKGIVL